MFCFCFHVTTQSMNAVKANISSDHQSGYANMGAWDLPLIYIYMLYD